MKKRIWALENPQNKSNITHEYIFKCGREWQTVVVRKWLYTNNRYLDDKYKWTKVQRSSVNRREREHTLRSTKQKHLVNNQWFSKIRDYRKRREEGFRKNVQRQPFPQPCAETRRGSSRFLFLFSITEIWKKNGRCDAKLISYLWQDPNNVKAEPFLQTIFHRDGWVESTR